jgi:hypothetical protein
VELGQGTSNGVHTLHLLVLLHEENCLRNSISHADVQVAAANLAVQVSPLEGN